MLDPRYVRYMSLSPRYEPKPEPKEPAKDESAVHAEPVREDKPAA